MAFIRTIDENEAEGRLVGIYAELGKRSGRISNIFKIQSNNPPALQGMLGLYKATMRSDSPLTLAQREMLALVVSKTNGCHY